MTLPQNPLRIAATLSIAMMTTLLLFTASAGQARGPAVAYTAELQAPVTASKMIIKGTMFFCEDDSCKAAKSSSAAKNICSKLSKKVGPLKSFSYKGEPMDDAALAKCND